MQGKPDLEAALAFLHRRGPDASGIWREGGAGLGHTRLSIIDLSPAGAQPMASPDGRYVIAFNGEIYNFPALRQELEDAGERFAGHSDTEVLLRLFARRGVDGCLARLRGMFAFAVWDRESGELTLARDRLGVKPLVYAETPDGFVFASEIGALFRLNPALPRTPDFAALDHFLSFQYIPAPLSGFAAVRKLQPAHALVVRDGRIARQWRYWSLDPARQSDIAFDDACAGIREKLLEATRLRLVSDVPLGAFLSGGVDSSITVAAMARLSDRPVQTFAIGFEDESYNELAYAREAARHLGTDHREMVVKADAASVLPELVEHFGEPHADSSALPTYMVSRHARQHVTVALTGDGGDESFAGYRRHYHASLMARLDRTGLTGAWRAGRRVSLALEGLVRPGRARGFPASRADEALAMDEAQRFRHLVAYFTEDDKARMARPEFLARLGAAAAGYLPPLFASAGADPVNRLLHVDLQTYLPDDVLTKVDVCSMLNSLECRSPLLDHELIEWAYALPGSYKLGFPHKKHKRLLKEAFRDWLPPGFLERRKMGFSVPLARWLRTDLAPLLRERLVAEAALAAWFHQDQVVRLVDEHLSGRASHAKRLWALLVLAQWKKAFAVPDA